MTDADRELQVFESEDGILLWGVPEALALVDEDPALTTRTIGPSNLVARLGNVLGGTSALMTESGRWLRLDDASVAYVRRHGVTNLSRGVLRTRDLAGGEGTRIAKHLRFSSVSLANPAGTAVLSSMATRMAIQHSLEQMQRCLEQIDVKVGRLIEADRTRVMSELDGFAGAVREAESLRVATGTVSATTWSKVENNSTPLRAHQSRAIRELRSLADEIEGCGKDVDGLADALTRAERETTFWMEVLARTILIQDEQYCVELERVASDTPDELEDHRRVIVTVRSERTASIIEALESISGSIARSAELSNAGCVMNPINSGRVTRHANRVNEIIDALRLQSRCRTERFATARRQEMVPGRRGYGRRRGRRGIEARARRRGARRQIAHRSRRRRGGTGEQDPGRAQVRGRAREAAARTRGCGRGRGRSSVGRNSFHLTGGGLRPARAGMIPAPGSRRRPCTPPPRAGGDDPAVPRSIWRVGNSEGSPVAAVRSPLPGGGARR